MITAGSKSGGVFFLVLLCLVATTAQSAVPDLRPYPGGIAVVAIDLESRDPATPPVVTAGGHRALLVTNESGWTAIIGIPLETPVGQFAITINHDDGSTTVRNIQIEPYSYREQRLTVSNQDYVSPGEAQLQRIAGERKIIDAALNNWRPIPLRSITLSAPVDGPRSSSFGLRRFFNEQPRSPHKGMDIAANKGTPILAPAAGIVTAVGEYFFNGNTVIVDHGQGFVTMYCHLDSMAVGEDEQISAGQVIGQVGATGRVTGPHLHFGTYLNGTAVNPAWLLTPEPSSP